MEILRCGNGEGVIYYRAAGRRGSPAVVLIHGAANDSRVYFTQLRCLSDNYRVIAPDLPGHGRSVADGIPDIGDFVEAVQDILAAEGIEAAVVGGHSMGGGVALEIYRRRPEAVRGLVFISTGAVLPVPTAVFELIEKDYGAFCGFLVELACGSTVPEQVKNLAVNELKRTDRMAVKNDFHICSGFDFRDMLSGVRVPSLVVASREDRLVPESYSRELAEGIPGSQLLVYESGGHMPHLENAEKLNRDLSVFIGQLGFYTP